MRGENFWKNIIVLCLTFWLGVLAFWGMSAPQKATPEAVVAETPNCVPVDTNLRYHLLSGDEKRSTGLEEKPKSADQAEKQYYRPGRDVYRYGTLLHKEHCYESKEQNK